jgi:tetratricopeptide (TPR) repeat protein
VAAATRKAVEESESRSVPVTRRWFGEQFAVPDLTRGVREAIQAALWGEGVIVTPSFIESVQGEHFELTLMASPRPHGRLRRAAAPAKNVSRRSLASVLAISSLLGGYAAVLQLWPSSPSPPTPMGGDFNVAVARFITAPEAPPDDQAYARTVSRSVFEAVGGGLKRTKVAESYAYEVRSPEEVGPVASESEADRLAGAVSADIVVYGSVKGYGSRIEIAPRFYVHPKDRRPASELGGSHDAGGDLSADQALSPPAVRREIRQKVEKRAAALTEVVVGLSEYTFGDYAAAQNHFQSAERDKDLDLSRLGRVAVLFQGNAAGKRGKFRAAEAAFRRALARDPDYVRAQLGLADVRLQRAGRCRAGTADREALELASASFARIEITPADPGWELSRARRRYGLARAGACQLLAGYARKREDLTRTTEDYRSVIRAYARGLDEVRDAAAGSHAGLALLALAFGEPRSRLITAYGEYRAALAAYLRPDRTRVGYLRSFARAAAELRRVSDAEAAEREADKIKRSLRVER